MLRERSATLAPSRTESGARTVQIAKRRERLANGTFSNVELVTDGKNDADLLGFILIAYLE
jgi:hypothetical protein